MLPFATELSRLAQALFQKHEKSLELDCPEKITVTFIVGRRSDNPVKKIIFQTSSEFDLPEPVRR